MNGFGQLKDTIVHSSYKGTFLNGKKFGNGKLEDSEGVYTGEFKNDMKNGEGEINSVDRKVYKGQWLNN